MLSETVLATRQRFVSDLIIAPNIIFSHLQLDERPQWISFSGKESITSFINIIQVGRFGANTSWGHASTEDLLHRTDLPLAIVPTPGGPDEAGCFSGCAVNNNSQPTFVYTGTRGEKHQIQTQRLATSDDLLVTWHKNVNNPVLSDVLSISGQTRDFRDPYVWKEADAWYMVVGSRINDIGGVVFLYK